MKRLLWILMAMLILSGCAAQPQSTDPTVPSSSAPTESTAGPTGTSTAPTETEPQPTETEPLPTETEPAPTEPVVLYRNPLTGEAVAEYSENRPYAIVFNNIKAAMPQYGVGSADILCEILAEGGITRCLGVYYDITGVETFGSIRSARPYLVSLAQSFDAIFVHAGRSDEAKEYLSSTGWDHLDGVHGSGAGNYFYRDQDRLNAGYSKEHTLFITSESILAYAQKLKCTLSRDGGVSYGFLFGDSSAAGGSTANTVTVRFSSSGGKTTTFAYDADTGVYKASQYGTAYIDAATGDQLTFRNVLVLKTSVVNQGDSSGHLTITLTGSGTGYYACDGGMIPIKWSRSSATDPFVFTTEDGTPITLGEGKTYMAVVPKKAGATFE